MLPRGPGLVAGHVLGPRGNQAIRPRLEEGEGKDKPGQEPPAVVPPRARALPTTNRRQLPLPLPSPSPDGRTRTGARRSERKREKNFEKAALRAVARVYPSLYIRRRGGGSLARPAHPAPFCLPTAIRSCRLAPQSASSLPLVLASLLSPNPWPEIGSSLALFSHTVCMHACLTDPGLSAVLRAAAAAAEEEERWRRRPRTWASSPWTSTSRPTACSRYQRRLCFPARQIRIPLRPFFPWIRRRRGHRARTRFHPFDSRSKACGRAGGVDTTTRFAWFPCTCACAGSLRVSAGFSLSKYRAPCLTGYYRGT